LALYELAQVHHAHSSDCHDNNFFNSENIEVHQQNITVVDDFLVSPYLPAWYCTGIVMSNLSLVSPGYNLTSTLLETKLSIPITQDIPTIFVYPFLELANQD